MTANCVFIFLVLAELPPDISILLLNGIFLAQFFVDIYTGICGVVRRNDGYVRLNSEQEDFVEVSKGSIVIAFFALLFQLTSLLVFVFLWSFRFMSTEVTGYRFLYRLRPMIGLALCLPVFSVIWTNKFQECLQARKTANQDGTTARYRSCKQAVMPNIACIAHIYIIYKNIVCYFIY